MPKKMWLFSIETHDGENEYPFYHVVYADTLENADNAIYEYMKDFWGDNTLLRQDGNRTLYEELRGYRIAVIDFIREITTEELIRRLAIN
jgi:hypothetical protein